MNKKQKRYFRSYLKNQVMKKLRKGNKSYNFFVSGDQLLKGAAYNSVQILKYIIDNKLI